MKCSRRGFLDVATGAVALSAVSRIGWAQAYPTRPVTLACRLCPAGGNDIVRAFDGSMAFGADGQQFRVENRAGSGQPISRTEIAVNAPADGYTLLLVGVSAAINCHPLRQSQLQFYPRHRAGRGDHEHTPLHGDQSFGFRRRRCPSSSAYAKSNPGKGEHGLGRNRQRGPFSPANCSI